MKKHLLSFSLGVLVFLLLAWSRPPEIETVVVERPVPVPVVTPTGLPERALVLELTLTAYSSTPDQTDSTPFVTASGQRVRDGIVAVSRDLEQQGLRFGSKVVVTRVTGPGCGPEAQALVGRVLEVQDRMHPRKRQQVDVWRPSREEALAIGRCTAEVVAFAPSAGVARATR
ncbi:hypothetical protein Ocepr_2281 (plasmid) [Oceanithermus profundus DSM 14977]|uniref:Uncharacterized protein n=1 Tax=Oceanithermus profundus (strain DSM 14977 / NBRC 100410 / VKM B-2274 / 506) TaxID=670487 RepID=E4UAU4_OCEP5|nr:3D domain-containing protein [Oceanithermus profundus]ADR37729.1 hypothetical protein Ocepr_2281 [Oceanithermus profundus DSM 14977]